MPTGQIDPRYGDASATAPAWDDIERLLTEAQLYWIVTVRVDGRPTPYPGRRVARGRVRLLHRPGRAEGAEPRSQPAGGGDHRRHGGERLGQQKDVVLEGTAIRVTDADALRALADAWFAKYGEDWRFEVRGAEFVELSHSGGSTEGGAWVYRVEADKVLAFGDAHGQTVPF